MFFSSIKGINRLISKRMSNIYLKNTIQKNENLTPGQFLDSSTSRGYQWILKRLVVTLKLKVWEQNCVAFLLF